MVALPWRGLGQSSARLEHVHWMGRGGSGWGLHSYTHSVLTTVCVVSVCLSVCLVLSVCWVHTVGGEYEGGRNSGRAGGLNNSGGVQLGYDGKWERGHVIDGASGRGVGAAGAGSAGAGRGGFGGARCVRVLGGAGGLWHICVWRVSFSERVGVWIVAS